MSVRDTPLLNILSWCRNVTLRSSFYPGTGMWHPIHILSWCRNVTLRSSYTILVSERDTPILILSWCRNVTPDPYSILLPERGTRSIYYPGVGTLHSDPHILSWYRNVAPDPYTILVSERDTPILIYYPDTGTWHPIHILSWCRNVTLWSSYTILVPERGTRSPNLTTFVHQAFFYTKASSLTK